MAAFLNLHGKSKPAKLTSFYRRAPNAAGRLYLRCQNDMPNTFAWVMSIHPYIHPINAMWSFGCLYVRPLSSQPIFSDEKNFNQDQMVNSQNNHWLVLFPQDVLIAMKAKHPIPITTVICRQSTPHMVSVTTFKPTSSAWKETVLPWIKKVTVRRPYYIWQTWFCIMPQKQESSVLATRKFLRLHYP